MLWKTDPKAHVYTLHNPQLPPLECGWYLLLASNKQNMIKIR